MQLKVIKADGSVEQYLHTKVIGTFSNALALIDQPNVFAAEQFADAITFYLYRKRGVVTVTSDEIHLMAQSVLTATGYENAASALNEHRLNRQLKRGRIEVIDGDETAAEDEDMRLCLWNKSRIVEDLIRKDKIDRHTARTIAASVEEKVLNLQMTRIRRTLIAELVLADTATMLRVQKQLQLSAV
jgi:transcriptional regulator NrdR family protein